MIISIILNSASNFLVCLHIILSSTQSYSWFWLGTRRSAKGKTWSAVYKADLSALFPTPILSVTLYNNDTHIIHKYMLPC